MTRYIINSSLVFDSAIAKLTFVADAEILCINLSAPASRCLENLILSRGNVLNKVTLLEKSWRVYGFVVTDNSVNQVISHIRKCFERLGLSKDIIVTVPKLGYQFNPEYHVEIENEKNPPDLTPSVQEEPASTVADTPLTVLPEDKPVASPNKYEIALIAAGVNTALYFIFSLGEHLMHVSGLSLNLITWFYNVP